MVTGYGNLTWRHSPNAQNCDLAWTETSERGVSKSGPILYEFIRIDEVLFSFLMMMCGWLPPCHEGAADCRPDRFLHSVGSYTTFVVISERIFTVTAFRQYRDKKSVQSHLHFADVDAVLTFPLVSTDTVTARCSHPHTLTVTQEQITVCSVPSENGQKFPVPSCRTSARMTEIFHRRRFQAPS